ncbi:3', 5'-cyclic nucleotide phosphodiesterase domain-containing protein, putative [Eimeria brunetti]|uniref:3', 5'-cyclic nucleotide phosphodiesterase domain-containing protein, putative n=1 Tax=Eimeria brunetti TaxID=51314 RepID=U6LFD3_9EIME|nr:3', 5'-cyclic nucleotide phosphodiesterase domain-containing protein, putative [Eimeria brunetti]
MAFCFVRDVETEQLLGTYAVRPAASPVQQACSTASGHDNHGECVQGVSQPSSALGKHKMVKSIHSRSASTLQRCFNALTIDAEKPHLYSESRQCGEPSLVGVSPEAVAFLSALLAEDARASKPYLPPLAQPPADNKKPSRAPSRSLSRSKSFQWPSSEETAVGPSYVKLGQPPGGSNPGDPKTGKPGDEVVLGALFPLSELIAVSSASSVGFLVNDLKDGSGVYCYEPARGRLSAVPAMELSQTDQSGAPRDSPPSATARGFLIACRIEDEGARSACTAMAAGRVAYVGPETRRPPPHPSASHQGAQPDGTALGSRLPSIGPVVSAGDALKTSSLPHTAGMTHQADRRRKSNGPHGFIPLLFSATLEQPTAEVDTTSQSPEIPTSGRGSCVSGGPHSAGASSRRTLGSDNPLLTAQPDLGLSVASWRAGAPDFPIERPSVDNDSHDDSSVATSNLHCVHSDTTLGIVFCLNAKRVDAQALLSAIAQACAPPMALLLQQQWLRRDRFKRVLQLELHRTVFQETSIPIRMMQRLLALLHAAVGAEVAAFFIADTQNRNFICLGGHKRATGLSLSVDHRLLGEAARQRGKTVVFNFLPQGFNGEYDSRARFESKHAMLVPLLNTQGHVKAVVVLLNRNQCTCERMKQIAEVADKQCACEGHVRALEPLALAVDAWSAAITPCEHCSRRNVNELSYGEFLTRPPSSFDVDCSRHFIGGHEALMRAVQCEMQHWLGGQLTNVCMAGMSLLQPMETMVSYVMGGQQGGNRDTRPLGAVMEQIQNFVLRDRRKMLLSLRRCASVAVNEPTSSRAYPRAREEQGSSISSPGQRAVKGRPIRHPLSIPAAPGMAVSASGERKASKQISACFEGADKDSVSAGQDSWASLPVAATVEGDVPDDPSSVKYPEQEVRLVHSSSAPLVLYSELRHSSTGGEELTFAPQLAEDKTSDEMVASRHRRTASLPSLVFSATLQKCTRPFDAIRKQLSLEPYRRLDLDIWRRTADELQLFFFLALEELGVMVKSEKAGLQSFFTLIRDAYHTDNPYHNFYHAMHVSQMCWLFLTRYSCRDALTPTEQLGLMLAALAHDVDHPGVNNCSLIEEHHPLAIVYNDKAVLENHHAAFAASAQSVDFRLKFVCSMMKLGLFSRKTKNTRKFSSPRSSALSRGASVRGGVQPFVASSAFGHLRHHYEGEHDCAEHEDDHTFYPSFAEVRRVLITCILATDMELFRHHHEAMRKRGQMKRTTGDFLNNDEDHAFLVTCLIHCADISNPLLPERRNVQWASLIIQEFNAQVEMERHKGLPVTVFMDVRTELSRTQSQIGFLSFVVLDQFRALADLVPGAEELVIQGEKNLDDWQAAMDILREADRREA